MTLPKHIGQIGLALAFLVPLSITPALAIDFGDNASIWANDGECDDNRFAGPGVDEILLDEDMGHDANDCEALLNSGQITFIASTGKGVPVNGSGIDFGSNAGEWVDDGECDDPRFEGPGTADILAEADRLRDANDCAALHARGQVALISTQLVKGFNFGDDSSEWSRDGECDDPRFQGTGVAVTLLEEDLGRDASDCRALFQSGGVTLSPGGGGDRVSFGDNTSEWSNDGECDDPRFVGNGMAATLLDEDAGHDANDCATLFFNEQIDVR